MASIAITIPREKRLNFCERADYEPVLDSLRSGAEPDEDGMFRPVCENVRLGTRLGSVRSSVQYCSTQIGSSISQPTLGMTAISVGYRQSGGDLISVVISEGQGFLLSHYVEWRRQQNGPTDEVLRSEFAEWSPKRHIRIVHEAIERVVGKGRCELDLDALQEIPVAGIDAVAAFMTCTVNTVEVQRYVSGYMRSALQWNRSNKVVSRINASGESVKLSSSDQCPIEVTVTRPVVNIVPLAVIMMLMFTINIATGITVARHGDVLDAAFHLVKEVMGYDCTSNPLEECIGDGKREAGGGGVELAEIRRYECADGVGRHVGFLRGDGCKVIGVGIDDDGDAANGPRGDSFGGGVVCRCRWADGSGRRWAEPAFPFDDAV